MVSRVQLSWGPMSNAVAPPPGVPPRGIALWVAGARPKTLPAAVVPVVVGTALADVTGTVVWWRAALAMVVSLALQVGVNYANDYSDGIRGTDDSRVGPLRLVGSGLVPPKRVKRAAFMAFAAAAVAGLALALVSSLWLILVGVAAIAAAWFYTGGSRPYGYAGLGEVVVFVFFGLVAVAGTAFVQTEQLSWKAVVTAVPVGLLSVALLVVNNLRDIPGDTDAGKNTLAVRLGDQRTRKLYTACLVGAISMAIVVSVATRRPLVLLALLSSLLAVAPARTVLGGAKGRDLIAVLAGTGKVQIGFGLLLSVGLVTRW